jgi:MFS family permease
VVAWGIVTACTAATTNYRTLLLARIFLGIFEAAISPSLMLIGSQWYTRSEQATRFSFWYCGLGLAQILGGVVSFAFQHIGTGGLAGWRIMFIALGFVTVVTGAVAALLLPDSPISANFLLAAEKVALLNHVSENRTGIESRRFKLSQLVELLLDLQFWLMALITILVG